MTKKLKFLNAYLCEHVVAGAGGKHTLVNVYAGDVLVSAMPANLMFGFYAEHAPEIVGTMRVSIQHGTTEIAAFEVEIDRMVPGITGVIAMPIFQFSTDEETTIEILATMPGSSKTSIVKKKILVAGGPNDPTVSRQPS